jgi:hypothetical protein
MDEAAAINLWNTLLGGALKIPGVRVDRASFLTAALAGHVPADVVRAAIEATPAKAGVASAIIQKAADGSIKWHRAGVSATSALAGLPGGWWIAGTIPADLAQFFWHVVVVVQKLAYLHGWPSLFQDDADVDDETKLVITLFIGVMLGVEGATAGVTKLATSVDRDRPQRLPRAPLTKYALYQLATAVAKWIGFKLTKKKLAEWLGRAMPIVGGGVAGMVTWLSFGGATNRLHGHLEGLPLAAPEP